MDVIFLRLLCMLFFLSSLVNSLCHLDQSGPRQKIKAHSNVSRESFLQRRVKL